MNIEIPSKKAIREMVKDEVKKQADLFYSELDKVRERVAMLNDELTILEKKIDMKVY